MQGIVVGFFLELLGFGVEDCGGVGFAEEDEGEDLEDDVGDCYGPESPSPGCVLGYETTGFGNVSKCRSSS